MRTTDRELLTAAILMAVIGLSTLVGGIIMLLPAHSGQAQPRLSHPTIPDVPPELDRRHLEETATYRDLKDPIRQECANPTPHSEEKPRDFYVTVAEDDRQIRYKYRRLTAQRPHRHISGGCQCRPKESFMTAPIDDRTAGLVAEAIARPPMVRSPYDGHEAKCYTP